MMEEKRTMEMLLEKQVKYAKWQCILTAAAAIGCVGVFVLVLSLLPQLNSLAVQMESVLSDLEGITAQTETILTNLDIVSGELAQADLKGMVEDFETLNQAIQNLADVVEPLARFFNIFD